MNLAADGEQNFAGFYLRLRSYLDDFCTWLGEGIERVQLFVRLNVDAMTRCIVAMPFVLMTGVCVRMGIATGTLAAGTPITSSMVLETATSKQTIFGVAYCVT